jgi:hypothetical protein
VGVNNGFISKLQGDITADKVNTDLRKPYSSKKIYGMLTQGTPASI